MAAAGMKWVAPNIGDFPASEWSLVVERANAAGVKVVPWARCYTPEKLAELVSAGHTFGSEHIIPNLEKHDGQVPDLPTLMVAEYLDANWDGGVGISTEGHTYDLDWFQFYSRDYVVMLQMFWEDARRDPATMAQWIEEEVRHARAWGWTYVAVSYQTVRSDPSWYDRRGTFSLYTADDVGQGNWARWGQQ